LFNRSQAVGFATAKLSGLGSVLSVYFPAMADFNHHDNQMIILDLINYSIVAMTNPIIFLAGQLNTPGRTWIIAERLHLQQNPF